VQKWKHGEKLSLKKEEYPNFDTPLIFIDPVDSERNVASALSKEKFDLFIDACKSYAKKPLITFFFPNEVKPWSLDKIKEEIEKQQLYFVGVSITKPYTLAENLYPQVRKSVRAIQDLCERYDFTVYNARFFVDDKQNKIYIVLQTKKESLSPTRTHEGPPTSREKNVTEFVQKWQNDPRVVTQPYEKQGRFYVELQREYVDIVHLLNDHIKTLSLGKHMTEMVKKEGKILKHKELFTSNLTPFWTTYLDKKQPWEW
jgi:tRNA nucleotidyltransferase (CCA-adding enzyme)